MSLHRSRSASLSSNGQQFVNPVALEVPPDTEEERRSHKRSASLGSRLKRALSLTEKEKPILQDPVTPETKSPEKSSKQKIHDVTTVVRDLKKIQQALIEKMDTQQAQFATLQLQLSGIAKNMDLLYEASKVARGESVNGTHITHTKPRADGYQALEEESQRAPSQCCTLI